MSLRLITPLLAAAVLLVVPSTASAWRVVSESSGDNTDEVSAVRTPDGTLHVVYVDDAGDTEGVHYRTVSRTGVLSTPEVVFAGWSAVGNPDIEVVDGAPVVFWAGLQDTDTANPYSSGKAWTASRATGSWVVSATPFTTASNPYASSQFSTAVDGSTPWGTWTQTSVLGVHTGFDPATPEQQLSTACCDYAANLGKDAATGEMKLVYYSNVTDGEGFFMRTVGPALGAPVRLPSAAGDVLSTTSRMSAASRTTGGGVFTAYCFTYPTCTRVTVSSGAKTLSLNLPAAQVPTISGSVTTAAAPSGRMWVSWTNRSGAFAARSNKAFTKWGPVQRVAAPPFADTLWSGASEGSRGWLDLFANITTAAPTGGGTFVQHQRFLPKLSITPPVLNAPNNIARSVRLRLTDAGDPVPGGKIRFRGTLQTVNALGYATFVLPAGTRAGTLTATGTAAGYVSATSSVRVTAPSRR